VAHVKVTLLDKLAKHPRLPLAHARLPVEVVTVHQGECIEDIANGEIVEGLFGKLSLRE
jgi:hypothetical protein